MLYGTTRIEWMRVHCGVRVPSAVPLQLPDLDGARELWLNLLSLSQREEFWMVVARWTRLMTRCLEKRDECILGGVLVARPTGLWH